MVLAPAERHPFPDIRLTGVSLPGVRDLRMRGVGVLPFSMRALRARHPDLFAETSDEGIEMIRSGALRPPIGRVLPLAEAAEAHRLVASRATMSKVLLAVQSATQG